MLLFSFAKKIKIPLLPDVLSEANHLTAESVNSLCYEIASSGRAATLPAVARDDYPVQGTLQPYMLSELNFNLPN